ncbi:MAG: glutamate synthase subunit beta [Campylobacterales bacterium]|nr:glutamate synthase subunit beta [Campylobacterales bacterium]
MQNFLKVDRQEPEKENVLARIKNFQEIYKVFDKKHAKNQAERCVQCGDPYCSSTGCPLNNFIPHWLKKVAENDLDLAFKISNQTSPFPEILGRICPQDNLCEGSCTLGDDGYGAITIGSIETAITERGFEEGSELNFPGITTDKKVAVVGSGPSGISAATFLLRAGIEVTLFEKEDRAGGLLTYGIPGFKLDKEKIARRIDILKEAGLILKTNCEVGKDIEFTQLEKEFDAIFLGVGASQGNTARIGGEDHDNVFLAMEYLTAIQKSLFGQEKPALYDVKDKNVTVIGGGDTAMDCVRTAVREGAKTVTCVYRRDEASMPGSKKEFKNAKDEGVEFLFHKAPKEAKLDKGVLVLEDTEIVEADGRKKVQIIQGSESEFETDIVIMALGFNNHETPYLDLDKSKWNEIVVDDKLQTSKSKIYAGGDCIRGADLAVTAARDGRSAALNIIEDLL